MSLRLALCLTTALSVVSTAGAQDAAQDASVSAADPVCGGIGALGVWAGEGADGSDIATAEGPFDINAEITAVRNSVTLFAVAETTGVRVEAQAVGDGDPEIALYGPTGAEILTDDDGGDGLSSRAQTSLEPGVHCLVTSNVDTGPMIARVRIGRTEHPQLSTASTEPETACEADDIVALHDGPIAEIPVEGISASASFNQTPAYGFTLGEAQALTIRADGTPADPVLRLYDSDGTLLGENDDTNGRNAQLDFAAPLPAGEYCIALQALSDDDAAIRVSLVSRSPEARLAELFATGKAAPPPGSDFSFVEMALAEGHAIADVVLEQGSATWARLTVSEPGLALIEAVGLTDTDPVIILFDALGRQIQQNDDAAKGTTDSLIAARVVPGEYLLSVTHVASGSPGPVRISAQQFVPLQAAAD